MPKVEAKISSDLLDGAVLKCSLYNFLFERSNNLLLFNSLKGTYLEIKPVNKSHYTWLGNKSVEVSTSSNGFRSGWGSIGKEAKINLLRGGYVIPKEFDELAYLSFQNKLERFRRDYFSITVVLTYACNMNCIYCYENAPVKTGYMSKKIATQLVKYVVTILKEKPRYLDITWYGGEPMLQYSLIIALSKKIVTICKSHKVKYSASIITNGTLLTIEKAQMLKKMHVESAQITLDGPPHIHDQRRPLKSGPSFNRILKNIVDIHNIIRVGVRCNIDRTNKQEAMQLVDILSQHGLANKISLNFAPVHHINGTSGTTGCQMRCRDNYSFREFSNIQHDLQLYAILKGFQRSKLPSRKTNACTADRANGIVVEPNGNLIKCWEYIGDESQIIGTIEKGVFMNRTALSWLSYDPFDYSLCKNCKILPLCMGWCPARVMSMRSEGACMTTRFNIIKQLINYYEHYNIAKRKGV